MFTQNFETDFEQLLIRQEPFAFVRFHDGEHAILEGIPYRAASKWTSAGGDVWFRDELEDALHSDLEGFYRGVSPPCCTPQSAYYYRLAFKGKLETVTYATLFQFKNYHRMEKLRRRFLNPLIVGSGKLVDIHVPGNGVTKEWDMDAVVDKMLESQRPILVAAGPCANILIYRYWQRQDPDKRQPAIDIGAAFDVKIHGKETREYHKRNSKLHGHVCTWDKWKPFAPVSPDQRGEAAERGAAQTRYQQLTNQGFKQTNVIKKNDPDGRVKEGGNILVSKRKPVKVIGQERDLPPVSAPGTVHKNLLKR